MRSKSLFLATALLAACAFDSSPDGGQWTVDHVEDDGAILSIWGTGDEVWAVGGEIGRGLLLHNDGSGWATVDIGISEMLWWVYGFGPTDLYAVGDGGLILHYDGVSWERAESGTDLTLYGVWGASGGDVWIVGGDAADPDGTAVILRGQGRTFEVVDDVPAEMAPNALYKIYGYGPDDVIAVGGAGTILRWDGEHWSRDASPTDAPLFSLWGRAVNDLYAVGGHGEGEILHFDGAGWNAVGEPGLSAGLSGVFTAPDRPVIAVGAFSTILEMQPGGIELAHDLPLLDPLPSLHGVWGDESGTTYAVGGDLFASSGPTSGVILRRH
jgi:hypothetical protein